ncbi:UDP-N-acetylmuramate--L-alanine ligase [candidate division KSB1 bacterium]
MRFGKIKHLHFTGIGGAGMNGLAEIMVNLGFRVSGSDLIESAVTRRMEDFGVDVYYNHDAENISSADVVIYSAAVQPDNPELIEAKRLNIPVIKRAVMLAEIMRLKHGICISGTHGKTTTTSMVGQVLTGGGLDPTVVVGGKVKSLESHVRLGTGDYLVTEADEFNRSFLTLSPTTAVITTLEIEHLDTYGEIDELKDAFFEFASKVPFYGCIIACCDEEMIRELLPRLEKRIITYGQSKDADYQPEDIEFDQFESSFAVRYKGDSLGYFKINNPGVHNVKNALAAIAVGMEFEVPIEIIRASLQEFGGVFRRFELKDEIDDVMIIDDYAHHPTEVKASLNAARSGWRDRKIKAIFQPHLFSRTRDFYKEFGEGFGDADSVIITSIYPAREKPIKGISGRMIADWAEKCGHKDVNYIPDKKDVIEYAADNAKPGDMIITLGAGDVWDISERIILNLKKKHL